MAATLSARYQCGDRFPVGAGLPAMQTTRCIRQTQSMPSQASQLPQINESEGQGAGHRHLPRIANRHKLRIHR
ncbi:hypothetical protein E4O98_06485 [Pseudomonas sp. W2Jun17]|nr:hypothetical protein [Pseudomonas sp. W2Jun17]